MKQIHKASLLYFQPKCNEHNKIVSKDKWYTYFANTDLFTQMLEKIEFNNVYINEDDYKKFIIEDKVFIGIDITDNIEFDEHHYLFNAFNVYYAVNNFGYYKLNEHLTREWRKTLVNEYPNSTYHAKVRKMVQAELQEIVEQFNKDNADLL